MTDETMTTIPLLHGPPLIGQPLMAREVAQLLSEMYGIQVAPVTVRQAVRRYRQRWEGRKRDAEPVDPARVGQTDPRPHPDELKCIWRGHRVGMWGAGPVAYLIDGDRANLEQFRLNLPAQAGQKSNPGRKIGSSNVRVPKRKLPSSA